MSDTITRFVPRMNESPWGRKKSDPKFQVLYNASGVEGYLRLSDGARFRYFFPRDGGFRNSLPHDEKALSLPSPK